MKMTAAQVVCECLLEQGVDTVFGYPGGTILNSTTRFMGMKERSATF